MFFARIGGYALPVEIRVVSAEFENDHVFDGFIERSDILIDFPALAEPLERIAESGKIFYFNAVFVFKKFDGVSGQNFYSASVGRYTLAYRIAEYRDSFVGEIHIKNLLRAS